MSQATNICLGATGKTYFFHIPVSFSAGHPEFHGWETLGVAVLVRPQPCPLIIYSLSLTCGRFLVLMN